MANRRNFVRAVKVEIIRRATRPDGQPACEQCGAIGCKLEIHHKKMDALELEQDKRARKLTADDGVLLCVPCHDPITSDQRKILAKVLESEAAHLGARAAPRRPLKGRDFADPPPKDRTLTKVAAGMPGIARQFVTVSTREGI